MKCAFCKLLLDTTPQKYGELSLIAPNGNGIVARLCSDCLLSMGQMLDKLIKGGFRALEELVDETDAKPVPLFVPPSVWRNEN